MKSQNADIRGTSIIYRDVGYIGKEKGYTLREWESS